MPHLSVQIIGDFPLSFNSGCVRKRREYDLPKLIIPFCTSGGSDIEETMPTFLDSCDGLAVYGQRRIGGSSQISGWLDDLALNL